MIESLIAYCNHNAESHVRPHVQESRGEGATADSSSSAVVSPDAECLRRMPTPKVEGKQLHPSPPDQIRVPCYSDR